MTEFENYFFTKLKFDTDIEDCYFCMPSNDCFTYCINELKNSLEDQLEENIKNNYVLELSKWFYSFLENDKILKKVDSLSFSRLLLLLKSISEGNSYDKKDTVTLLIHIRNSLSYRYFARVKDELLKISSNENIDFDYFDYLIELFLNECLARGIDIRFIHKTIEWYENDAFQSFESFLNFFINKVTIACDIYIPIKNYKIENKDVFKKNDQEIVHIEDGHYLHIYENNTIDYYGIIAGQMIRIESIFNTIKLYTNSEIDYNYDNDILIEIQCRDIGKIKNEFLPFYQLIKYKGVNPYSKFMINSITNLKELYDVDKDLYHKILNIVGYSEKNNDLMNSSSYVDSWIALESLYSLNATIKGHKSVKKLLPSFISSKIIINKLTFILKNAFKNKTIRAEEFIKMTYSEVEEIAKSAKSLYFKRQILKIKGKIIDIKELMKYYNSIEERIDIDVTRIYMLRNRYVHESKLSAFRSLQFYHLRNYLILSIDLFFNMLDQRIKRDRNRGDIAYSVFARLKEKNDLRQIFFVIFTEKRKYKNNSEVLSINEIGDKVSLTDAIMNILFNNNSITKKFIKYENR